eukprot:879368-Amphidinium_carterae.1
MQTMNIYNMEQITIGMMQKMNIRLPSPTQFDGRYPHFYEWAGKDKYTANEVRKLNTKFPIAAQKGEDDYDEYMDMTVNIQNFQKMKGDIVNFSQTVNYVLLHATKPGSEAHSIMRRVMRQ